MDTIDLQTLEQLLRGRPGLVIGAGMTIAPRATTEIAQHLQQEFAIDSTGNYLNIADEAFEKGISERQIRDVIKDAVRVQVASPMLGQLAAVPFNAVFSAAIDSHFEHKMQRVANERHRNTPVTVTNLMQAIPPRTVPVFKLLGDVARDDVVVSRAEYLQRRTTWRYAVPVFAAQVRGGPVLCLGMSDVDWLLDELLAEMVHNVSSAPTHLLFLKDDPLVQNRGLQAIFSKSATKLHVVSAGLSDLAKALSRADRKGYTPHLPLSDHAPQEHASLLKFSDICVVVNSQLSPMASAEETSLLLDLLFSPAVPRWDAIAHRMHLPRTLARTLLDELKALCTESPNDDIACVITGETASGKTMLLKELAFSLAREGHIVLWHKQTFSPDAGRQLRSLFDELARVLRHSTARVFYFFDDPIASHEVSIEAVAGSARAAGVPVTVVTAVRSSDWATSDIKLAARSLTQFLHHHLADALDETEWGQLPAYLVHLGIAPDLESATRRCNTLHVRNARDTLSMLYWLLPQTRSSIDSSIREEYLRLGDLAGLRKVIIGTRDTSTQFLQDAYSMVAVADHHGIPLPIEVLVSALNIDYAAWLNVAHRAGPAWGILYGSESDDGATYYCTRNSIVTDVLLEMINGGTQSHAGEFHILLQLLRACQGRATPVYREFCEKVLVPQDRPSLRKFNGAEGLQLYDTALASLPHPDATIKHHRGLWIKNMCGDPIAALAALEDALHTPPYPYTSRGEAQEHIHNSIAATLIDAMNAGKISLEDGRQQIFAHLSQARSADFFNPRAAHVHANAALLIIPQIAQQSRVDTLTVMSSAIADIDSSLLVLENPIAHGARDVGNIQTLEEARERLFGSISHILDLNAEAASIWGEFRSQEGFLVEGSRLLSLARSSNKRKHFNRAYEYCLQCRRLIESSETPVSPRLSELQLQIYWMWRVDRDLVSPGETRIQWEIIKDLAVEVLRGPTPRRNPLYSFMVAIASAHTNDWVAANRIFAELRGSSIPREQLWKPRALLMNDEGGRRQVQGTIRVNVDRKFLYVQELHQDFQCDRRGRWSEDGEIDFANVQFSFGGARAVNDLGPTN